MSAQQPTNSETKTPNEGRRSFPTWIFDLLLVLVLVLGAYFRATGLSWGEYQYLHPDERFLAWVGTDITPIKSIDPATGDKEWISLSDYFDTANSPLNPNNRGHGFYVYGTLPLFLARFTVEFIYGHSGFDPMTDVGRALSAISDLAIVLLVYLVGTRLYNKKVGLLAAAFSAVVVLQIQQSHFFTMDNFVNVFSFLAFYIAVRIQTDRRSWHPDDDSQLESRTAVEDWEDNTPAETKPAVRSSLKQFFDHPLFLPGIAFGVAFGMAMASKLNAAPVALLLPAAVIIRISKFQKQERIKFAFDSIKYLILAGVASFIVFRILQPYAFSGPGILGIKLNPQWLAQIQEQRAQASVYVDFPPAMQWARRTVLFSFQNLTQWGLGLPLGILSWVGFIWVGWEILKGKWQTHALIWGWTASYFIWQSLAFNPTMRYQLPIYPTLVILAAWAVITLYQLGVKKSIGHSASSGRGLRVIAVITGGMVFLLSAAYAFGFTRIYNQPITRLDASRWIIQNIPGAINVRMDSGSEIYNQPISYPYLHTITPEQSYLNVFQPKVDGTLQEIYLPHVNELSGIANELSLRIKISEQAGDQPVIFEEILSVHSSGNLDQRGDNYSIIPEVPILLHKDTTYLLELNLESDQGVITLEGATLANEGEWDDAVPFRVDGYDPFAGIYPPDVNFNMYWEETPDKLERFLRILEQSDYLAITSSRQWGSLPRIPERFPLSTVYYRELIGCPEDREIEWCYNVAEPGTFEGRLGFDLVKIFQSDPAIGSLRVNDQFAEEAFTVYDHPKVFIFEKRSDYNQEQVSQILGTVDFSRIVRLPPLQYETHPADLMLPATRSSEQLAGGTWSQIFDTDGVLNRNPILGVFAWYISLSLLGLIVYPIIRVALPGLSDKGYPLARAIGLLMLSYLVWLASSMRIPFSRPTITVVLGILLSAGLFLAYRQRDELRAEWRSQRRYYLIVEAVVLLTFVVDLLIRYGNPDLWHPWKGGEKPMDFAYLNAVLKSTSFPPFDPWYSGGYLNYYYYGFMLVGVLIKWLGIVPSVAYNLVLPTIFSLIAVGAFSVAWNISRGSSFGEKRNVEPGDSSGGNLRIAYISGIAGALGMAVLGNLGTVKMIVIGFQRIAAPGGVLENGGFLMRIVWTLQGFVRAVSGTPLPYGVADWYWLPSRIIPAQGEIEPITEFPIFTVLYGDPHAHLFALPIAILAISFALSLVLAKGRWRNVLAGVLGILLGGMIVGALRPTNTWDYYTYLAIGATAMGYAILANYRPDSTVWRRFGLLSRLGSSWKKVLVGTGGVLIFVGVAFFLYQPYANWYALGYTAVDIWQGSRTPLHAYFLHWGLFLLVIVSWMAWETLDWMASTPVSALQKLRPYREIILVLFSVLILLTLALGINIPGETELPFGNGVNIAWVVIPLGVWAGLLLFRRGISDAKRFVLFLVGSGLVLTLMVEVIVLRGDIGRMNTVFKFYLQVWTLFALSGAAALGWVLKALPRWSSGWQSTWQIGFVILLTGTAMYPLLASRAKIQDRMAPEAPKTLDGMEYMKYATYLDSWGIMELKEDYGAIRWLQENVQGSPVIVEANLRNLYHWGSRMSIYTGLPGVVGWEWHQQQQRAILPGSWITERIFEVDEFYTTTDLNSAIQFLNKYGVRYIVLGQQERGHYAGSGLDKFEEQNGSLWNEVYRDGNTVIYEVLGS